MNKFFQVSISILLQSLVFAQTTPTPFPTISILDYNVAADSFYNVSLDGSFVSAVRILHLSFDWFLYSVYLTFYA
jgi:hypothetical protein